MVVPWLWLGTSALILLLQTRKDNHRFQALLQGCQLLLGHQVITQNCQLLLISDVQLPLSDYLLKPVQRLLKYPLLLRELIKAVNEDDEGYLEYQQANKLICRIADRINEGKRLEDMAHFAQEVETKLVGWDGPSLSLFGRLLDAGDFKMTDAQNKKQQRKLLLFSEALMILKTRAAGDFTVKQVRSAQCHSLPSSVTSLSLIA